MRTPLPLVLLLGTLPLLAGCPSKGGGGADTITVSGLLVTRSGSPTSGLEVMVSGQVATTDSAGTFTIENVESPYDIFVYDPLNDLVSGVLGATRPDPSLEVNFGTFEREGTVDVTLSPGSVGGESQVLLAGAGLSSGSNDPDSFSVVGVWSGAASRPAQLFVTRVIDTSGILSHVYDHGAADVTFQDNQTIAVPLTMAPINTVALTVTGTISPGYEFDYASADTLTGANDLVLRNGYTFTENPTNYIAFDSALYTTRVSVSQIPSGGTGNDGYGSAFATVGLGTTAVTLEPPVRIELTSPLEGSSFGTGDTISWTSPLTAAAGNFVALSPAVPGPELLIFVGPLATFTMPDLTPLGVSFTGAYFVGVAGVDPGESPDDKLDGNVLFDVPATALLSVSEGRAVQAVP